MNSYEAQEMMKAHGYLRRIHFGETSLSDPISTVCQATKMPLGAGAIEFSRDKQGDFITKNLFAVVLLDRVFFSPEKNTFYALATTTMPSVHNAVPFSNTIQTWAALSPQSLSESLDRQAGIRPLLDSGQPQRGPMSRLINRIIHPRL